MQLIVMILLCLYDLGNQYFATYMPSDEQIQTNDIEIDQNDDYIIANIIRSDITKDYAFSYGIWSRFNPLTQIRQIGSIGMFDSSCYHLHSVIKRKSSGINFLYYDCLDVENRQITKNIRFRDNSGLNHLYTIPINPDQYESYWYFFSIMTWPHLGQTKMFVMMEQNQIFFQEIIIKFPYFDKSLTLNIGGGANGFYFSEQIQFSYFPGSMYALNPQYDEIDPEINQGWTDNLESTCKLPSDLTILKYNYYKQSDVSLFPANQPNKNYFLLVGWIKIISIVSVDQDFTSKLIKMTTKSQNSRLTDDNLSPFCLYYHISNSGNQIIFTTYSYSFPSVNVDFKNNPFLLKQAIDLSNNIKVWQYFTVKLSGKTLSVQIIFYDDLHSTYNRKVQVVQFQDVVFQLQIGNILQRKDNYINFMAQDIKLVNCNSVALSQNCDISCSTCDGPSRLDCLSCSLVSQRIFIPQSKQCNCPYNTLDKNQCLTYSNLSLNVLKGENKQKTSCPFGYFLSKDEECFQCPSVINQSQITCLECLNNPNIWINMLYCSSSLVSYKGGNFKLITEDSYYFTFDGSELNYCKQCQTNCLDEKCIQENYIDSLHFSTVVSCFSVKNTHCSSCNIVDCEICGFSEDQQLICLVCNIFMKYEFGKCVPSYFYPVKCLENCSYCYTKSECNFCYLPYYLDSYKTQCKLCKIPNCLYCFEFQINDRTTSTLYKNFQPFELDENTRIGCSLCVEGFNFDFESEKCVQSIPKIKDCVRSYTEYTQQEVCLLSGINNFNVAPQIINCQFLIANCEQCLLTPSLIIQCVLCEKGYSASYITGQCRICEAKFSEYCLDGTVKLDYWVQLIQSFMMKFLPDNYMYGFQTTVSSNIAVALSCASGYRLNRKNQCVKDCDIECLSCLEDGNSQGSFYCDQCPINYYSLNSLSANKTSCLVCPQLCLTCVERTTNQITKINPMFVVTTSNLKFTYQCLKTVPDQKVIIDPISLIAMYCFFEDCNNIFEYKAKNINLQIFNRTQITFYEKKIDIDYCNRMGFNSFQLTIQITSENLNQVFTVPVYLKESIFSLQKNILLLLGSLKPNQSLSSSLSILQFDTVKWQNISYNVQPGTSILLQNNGLPIELAFLNSTFKGKSEKLTFIQNANFKKLTMKNITFQNLSLKGVTWLEFNTNQEEATIDIEELVISNCLFENVTLFSILYITGEIKLNKIRIMNSQLFNTSFLQSNQKNQFKVNIFINDFLIQNCNIESSNIITQIGYYSLDFNKLQLFNSKLINTILIFTDNNMKITQLIIDQVIFIVSSFIQVSIESSVSNVIDFDFFNFFVLRSNFTESKLIDIHFFKTKVNYIKVLLSTFEHNSLNSITMSQIIISLYHLKCSQLLIQDIKILNSFNVSYFNVYQTELIQVTGINYTNLNQENKILAFQECSSRIKNISTLLYIQGYHQVNLKKMDIVNQYSIDFSLIQIISDQLFYKNNQGIVNIQQVRFFGNILIKQNLGNIFSLLAIYSDYSQRVVLKEIFFEQNFFNQIIDDPSKSAASLIYVNAQLSTITIELINFISNGLTNSSYPFMMINSLTQNYKNINIQNSNSLDEQIWNKYYQIEFEQPNNNSNIITQLIEEIFTISNIGVCQIITSVMYFEDGTFLNINSYSRSLFDITTQGFGIIDLIHLNMTNITAALYLTSVVEGCITISSQISNLNLQAEDLKFKQVNNRLDSAIFTIYPSKKQNQIKLVNVDLIDCYSLINTFLNVQFQQESQSNLKIKNIMIKNSETGLQKYLDQILFPNTMEINKMKSVNALISVQNGNFHFDNIFVSGIMIQQVFLLRDSENGKINDVIIYNVQLLNPVSASEVINIKGIFIVWNLTIAQTTQIQLTKQGSNIIQLREKIIITKDYKSCIFSIKKADQKISRTINDLIDSLNNQPKQTGSLISITGNSKEAEVKMNKINIYLNVCNFCSDGLLFISQNLAKILFDEFQCYGNSVKQYGCLNFQIDNLIQNLFAIKNSAFINNTGTQGAGITSKKVLLKIKNTLFLKNKALYKGGALYMEDTTNYFIINKCMVLNNSAEFGGGIYLAGAIHLTEQNFDSSINQFNTANSYSNNLVEAPDHLTFIINNIEIPAVLLDEQNKDMLIMRIPPYQLVKGQSQYTTSLYIPSGQQIRNYMLFNSQSRLYKQYISEFSLTWKNSMNEELLGSEQNQCQIFNTTSQGIVLISEVIFDIQNNHFDLLDLKFILNPYNNYNENLQIVVKCISIVEEKTLWYQFDAKTIKCQQGEFLTNDECKVCQSAYGYYSVTINATSCSIFDKTKFYNITSNQINLKEGYWRPKFTSNYVEFCFKTQQQCIGGWEVGNNLCYPGYIGGLCEACDIYNIQGYGYYAQSGTNKCNICSETSYQYIPPIFLITWSFISLLLSLKSSQETSKTFARLRATTKLYEILFKFSQSFENVLLKMFLNYLWIFSVIFTFNISFDFSLNAIDSISTPSASVAINLDCLLSQLQEIQLIYQKILFMITFIMIQIILVSTGFKILSKLTKTPFDLSLITNSFLYLFITNQATLIKNLSSLIAVRTISEEQYVQGNVAMFFYQEYHLKWVFSFILPCLLIIGLIIPLILFLILYCFENSQNTLNLRKHLGYLFNDYNQKNKFWEQIRLLVRTTIIIFLTTFENNVYLKACLISLTLLLYQLSTQKRRPYSVNNLNMLDIESGLIVLISIFLALIKFISEQNENLIASNILQIIIIILLIGLSSQFIIRIVSIYLKKYSLHIINLLAHLTRNYCRITFINFYFQHFLNRELTKKQRLENNYCKIKSFIHQNKNKSKSIFSKLITQKQETQTINFLAPTKTQ